MTFPIKLMEEGRRDTESEIIVDYHTNHIFCESLWLLQYTTSKIHKYRKNAKYLKDQTCAMFFFKTGGSRISNMTFKFKSKLYTYKYIIYIFWKNRGFNDIKYDTRTNNNNDPDPMTMDPTPTDPMTTNSYQTTMNPDRILNLPPFISALNYHLQTIFI